MNASFELRGLSKRYGAVAAVDPLDLRIAPGRTTVLIGPSGSGKSTLLRLMLGLLPPSSGEVRFGGAPVTSRSGVLLRRRMGYVVQDGGLFAHLTARGNAVLMARYLGWTAERVEARLQALCELTRFPPDGLDRYPAQLSGGQRQRVGLMRALMLDPEALLLDEPMASLDPMIRSDLQADLRRIFRALGKTVVLVTHDLGEAAFLGDELILLWDGAVLQRGPPAELVNRPTCERVARFVRAQRPWSAGEEAP